MIFPLMNILESKIYSHIMTKRKLALIHYPNKRPRLNTILNKLVAHYKGYLARNEMARKLFHFYS